MEKLFIPYELALKLKELGFNEECLARYCVVTEWEKPTGEVRLQISNDCPNNHKTLFKAPLWSQVFDWFREKHNYHYEIFLTSDSPYDKFHYRVMEIGKYFTLSYDNFEGTYEEARQACLEKLIELCNKII